MTTRRQFLGTGISAAVAGFFLRVDVMGIPLFKSLRDNQFTSKMRSLIGERFFVTSSDGGIQREIKLVEVRVIEHPHDKELGIKRECVSLLFEGKQTEGLKQGTYRFNNWRFGEESFFLVPVTSEQGLFEVTVNKLVV
ncbi:MAG: hypothetical protein HKN33_05420 [Pyrinomonadaceae bacterium]|nr:hypothetical protein [Pyrinomonadaceae bacterium]